MNTKPFLAATAALSIALSGETFAQGHQVGKDGQKTLSAAAVQQPTRQVLPAGAVPANSSQAPSGPVGTQLSAMGETEFARKNKMAMGIEMSSMDNTVTAENWSRMMVHTDESYTVNKVDDSLPENANGNIAMIQQDTKAKTGQLLWQRFIRLDQVGNPVDVMMYDGRKTLRYRGVLVYNRAGDFEEEVLYDTEGVVLRRRIQPYDALGNPGKEKVIVYSKALPPGLQVIVTEEDQFKAGQKVEEKGFFEARKEIREMKKAEKIRAAQNPGGDYQTITPMETKERKGLGALLFGKKRR